MIAGTYVQIVNIELNGDRHTIKSCCFGVYQHGTIAIGSHGCIRIAEDKRYFQEGLAYVVSMHKPKIIVIYGSAPKDLFDLYRDKGIEILHFSSDYALSRKGEVYGRG